MKIKKVLAASMIGCSVLGLASCDLIIGTAPQASTTPSESVTPSKPTPSEVVAKAKVSLSYVCNDETLGAEEMEYTLNEVLSLNEYVKKFEGYKFVGWYGDSKLECQLSADKLLIVSDAKIYAKYEKIQIVEPEKTKYTIKAVTLGSTKIMQFEEGSYVDLSIFTPNVDGYVFKGWYLDPEFKNPSANSFTIKSDVTVYAKLEKKEEPVVQKEATLRVCSGLGTDDYKLEKGTINLSKYIPSHPKYEFKGWFYDSSYSRPVENNAFELTEDITLYAKLEKVSDVVVKEEANVRFIMPDNSVLNFNARLTDGSVTLDLKSTLTSAIENSNLQTLYRGMVFRIAKLENNNYITVKQDTITKDETYYVFADYLGDAFMNNFGVRYNNLSFGTAWNNGSNGEGEAHGNILLDSKISNSYRIENEYLKLAFNSMFTRTSGRYVAYKNSNAFKTDVELNSSDCSLHNVEVTFFNKKRNFVVDNITKPSGQYDITLTSATNPFELGTQGAINLKFTLRDTNDDNNFIECSITVYDTISNRKYGASASVSMTGTIDRVTFDIRGKDTFSSSINPHDVLMIDNRYDSLNYNLWLDRTLERAPVSKNSLA